MLLKNPDNLNADKDEHNRLAKALELNKPLATAYYLKEDLRQFWNQKSITAAEKHLLHWAKKAESTKIPMLNKFAKTLRAHKFGLFSYYDYPISTGLLEGTSNKIKTLQKQAYGYRDLDFFKLKIPAPHHTFGTHFKRFLCILLWTHGLMNTSGLTSIACRNSS